MCVRSQTPSLTVLSNYSLNMPGLLYTLWVLAAGQKSVALMCLFHPMCGDSVSVGRRRHKRNRKATDLSALWLKAHSARKKEANGLSVRKL